MRKKNILAVIPARMKSSRFPGKPLADLCGKPMVIWVCQAAQQAKMIDKAIVATDSEEIVSVCKHHNFDVVLTSESHKTGTDRVAEVAKKVNADIYVNVQGDEPLIEPETIDKTVSALIEDNRFEIVNLYTKITNPSDINDINVPKVVLGSDSRAVFFSRLPIPFQKKKVSMDFYRQVCVYVFTKNALSTFSKLNQGPAEKAEEIELLRFLEHGMPIKMIETNTRSFGVDTPGDLERVSKIIREG